MTDHGCSPNGSEQLLGRVLEAVRRGDLDSVAQSLEPDLAAWLADHTLQRSKPNWLPLAYLTDGRWSGKPAGMTPRTSTTAYSRSTDACWQAPTHWQCP